MFNINLYICLSLLLICSVVCQENSTESPEDVDDFGEYDSKNSYCFRFTWLGPNYDNTTTIPEDEDCKKIIEKNKLRHVPCRQPLVITSDGTLPDFDYLLQNHRDQVLCKRGKDTSCVKYSYSFNSQLRNVTYMCAKVSALNEGEVTSGCWTEYDEDGLETQVCVCQPYGNIPCNEATLHKNLPVTLFFFLFYSILYN